MTNLHCARFEGSSSFCHFHSLCRGESVQDVRGHSGNGRYSSRWRKSRRSEVTLIGRASQRRERHAIKRLTQPFHGSTYG